VPTHADLIREPHGLYRKPAAPNQLTQGAMGFDSITPMPDGKKLLVRGLVPRFELVQYDQRSRQFIPFLSGISADDLEFSRDGKWVVYVSEPDKTLWRSRIDGTDRLQLTSPPVLPIVPRWSPDGARIVYTDAQHGRSWRNLLVSAQGGPATEMYPENDYQCDPTWSPDGQQLVYGRTPYVCRLEH
jgi:hypothetical protein